MTVLKIGYIGLGALGSELARRFLGQYELKVWDLNPAACERLAAEGAQVAASPAELARSCDVILTCLPRSADVYSLIFGSGDLQAGLSAGKLFIDQTSGIPQETLAIAQRLAEIGVGMMDAAVSASPHVVAQGGATLMVSGTEDVVARAMPVLQSITKTVYRCGLRVGDGQAMKMVNNAMNGACRLGTLESVAMGRRAGLSLSVMTSVLNHGDGRNQTTEKMLPALLRGEESTNFSLSLMLKDVNQAVGLGVKTGAPMPVSGAVRALLQIGQATVGSNARLEDMVGVIQSLASTRLVELGDSMPTTVLADCVDDFDRSAVGYAGSGSATMCAVVHRLLATGKVRVHVQDPTVSHVLREMGAIVEPDLISLARNCDVIFTCFDDEPALVEALFGANSLSEGLAIGKVVIDQGVLDPLIAKRLATELEMKGVEFVDAPLSGDVQHGRDGECVLMAGGAQRTVSSLQSVFRAITPHTVYCGGSGMGYSARIVDASIAALGLIVTYECVAVGLRYGLSLEDMAKVLVRTSGWSAAAQGLLPALANGQRIEGMVISAFVREQGLATELGIRHGAPLIIASAVRSIGEIVLNQCAPTASINELTPFYESMASSRLSVH